MSVIASAPGKLILIGEYAVLEGAPAIVTAISRYAKVTFKNTSTNTFSLHSPTFNIYDLQFQIDTRGKVKFLQSLDSKLSEKIDFIHKNIEQLFQKYKAIEFFPCKEITLDTDDFYIKASGDKLGLGSSAALTVAFIYAFIHEYSCESGINNKLIYKIASELHFKTQGGLGSGVDIAASSFGGCLKFKKNNTSDLPYADIVPIRKPTDLFIIPIWSGYSTSTPNMIDRVKYLKKTNSKIYWKLISKLTEIALNASVAFVGGKIDKFLGLSEEYYFYLKKLGKKSQANIISETHQRIAAIVKKKGGVYKISGAGGGDIGLAFTNSQAIHRQISDSLLHQGLQILNLDFDQVGPLIKTLEA